MPYAPEPFRPPWLRKASVPRKTAAQRGYCTASWQRTRLAVIARDGSVCQLCGMIVLGKDRDAHVDHIIPRGSAPAEVTEALKNLRLLCRSCHSKRHAGE